MNINTNRYTAAPYCIMTNSNESCYNAMLQHAKCSQNQFEVQVTRISCTPPSRDRPNVDRLTLQSVRAPLLHCYWCSAVISKLGYIEFRDTITCLWFASTQKSLTQINQESKARYGARNWKWLSAHRKMPTPNYSA